jgi:hypothetical protein
MLLFDLTGKAGQNGPRTYLNKRVSALISQAFDRLNPPHTAAERTTLTPGAITASPSTKAQILFMSNAIVTAIENIHIKF